MENDKIKIKMNGENLSGAFSAPDLSSLSGSISQAITAFEASVNKIAQFAATISEKIDAATAGTSKTANGAVAKANSTGGKGEAEKKTFFGKVFGAEFETNKPTGTTENGDQKAKDQRKAVGKGIGSMASAGIGIADTIIKDNKAKLDKDYANRKKAIDQTTSYEMKKLEERRKKGAITEKEYQREVFILQQKAAEEKDRLDRELFLKKKQQDTKQAIINTALSIGKAFAEYAFPWSLIPASIAAATGATQIATIQSQQYAKGGIMALGKGIGMGVLSGASHLAGGMQIMVDGIPIGEVEGGEVLAVINKNSAAKYLPLLSAINSQDGYGNKFARGGILGRGWSMPSPAGLPNPFRDQFAGTAAGFQGVRSELSNFKSEALDYIENRLNTLKVVVMESDITETQQNVKKIRVQSAF